jgi:hypothetical protein
MGELNAERRRTRAAGTADNMRQRRLARPFALSNQALQGVAALVNFQAQPRHLVDGSVNLPCVVAVIGSVAGLNPIDRNGQAEFRSDYRCSAGR